MAFEQGARAFEDGEDFLLLLIQGGQTLGARGKKTKTFLLRRRAKATLAPQIPSCRRCPGHKAAHRVRSPAKGRWTNLARRPAPHRNGPTARRHRRPKGQHGQTALPCCDLRSSAGAR